VDKMRKMVLLGSLISLLILPLTCAPIAKTQKPPLTIVGEQIEKKLATISRINPTLSEELRRLPELKRGLDEKGVLALNRILRIILNQQILMR
jgi:hypothetical protein